jgi:DNA replication protein DnaC
MMTQLLARISEKTEARHCYGVPPIRGPRVECGLSLDEDSRVCSSCSLEIERRNSTDTDEHVDHGRRAELRVAGLSAPYVDGRKSLATVRPLTAEHGRAIAAVRQWLAWTADSGNSLGILLRGDPGVGKSDISEAAIQAARLSGRSAAFVNCRALAIRLQDSYREGATESVSSIIDYYSGARFLALDDLGATKTTRFVVDAIYLLLERRARDGRPTIITTNYLSMTDLATRLRPPDGDALDSIRPCDRVQELCPRVFDLRGRSLRSQVNR